MRQSANPRACRRDDLRPVERGDHRLPLEVTYPGILAPTRGPIRSDCSRRIDADVSSVVRGLTVTGKPNVQVSDQRAAEMLTDDARFAATPATTPDIHAYPDEAEVE